MKEISFLESETLLSLVGNRIDEIEFAVHKIEDFVSLVSVIIKLENGKTIQLKCDSIGQSIVCSDQPNSNEYPINLDECGIVDISSKWEKIDASKFNFLEILSLADLFGEMGEINGVCISLSNSGALKIYNHGDELQCEYSG